MKAKILIGLFLLTLILLTSGCQSQKDDWYVEVYITNKTAETIHFQMEIDSVTVTPGATKMFTIHCEPQNSLVTNLPFESGTSKLITVSKLYDVRFMDITGKDSGSNLSDTKTLPCISGSTIPVRREDCS